MPCRLKSRGFVKCTDMEMGLGRQGLALARQRRPAFGAESPPPTRRRIELCYLTFGNGIRRAVECHEDGDGRTAMLATTLAMAPSHRFRLTGGDEADRAAQAATLKLIAHGTEPPLHRFASQGSAFAAHSRPNAEFRSLGDTEDRHNAAAKNVPPP